MIEAMITAHCAARWRGRLKSADEIILARLRPPAQLHAEFTRAASPRQAHFCRACVPGDANTRNTTSLIPGFATAIDRRDGDLKPRTGAGAPISLRD